LEGGGPSTKALDVLAAVGGAGHDELLEVEADGRILGFLAIRTADGEVGGVEARIGAVDLVEDVEALGVDHVLAKEEEAAFDVCPIGVDLETATVVRGVLLLGHSEDVLIALILGDDFGAEGECFLEGRDLGQFNDFHGVGLLGITWWSGLRR
jgi:hypothetical protein